VKLTIPIIVGGLALTILGWLLFRRGAENTVVIGIILPLSGGAAQWGIPSRDAVLLAVDQANTKGGVKGKKIILQIEDDQCNPAFGVAAVEKILVKHKPIAIVGALCSAVTLAIAPIVENAKVVLISPGSTTPLLTHVGRYFFRVIPSDAVWGKAFAEYIYSQGHRRVSCLYINNIGGFERENAFLKTFRRLGGQVISVDSYSQDTQDVKPHMMKIKGSSADAILIVSGRDDTLTVLRQAAELKVGLPLFFRTEALDDAAMIQQAGDIAEGATYILPAKPTGSTVDEFTRLYHQRYGNNPESLASEAYDAAMLVVNGLNSSAQLRSDALRDRLNLTQNYAGASGTFSFDSNGDVIKPMAIKQVRALKSVVVSIQ
jgi:branched-chain amino acid transport system substrate-binding protein